VDPEEPMETFGSSGSTESPIQFRIYRSLDDHNVTLLVDDSEQVSKAHVEHFFKWFRPFEGSTNLFCGSETGGFYTASQNGQESFKFEEILDIINAQ
jgi:hypothetical protein